MPRKTGRRKSGSMKYDALMRLAEQQFGMPPEMIVQVVSNYNGGGQLLQWGYVPPYNTSVYPRAKFYGRFACYLLKVHDGGALLEEDEEEKEPMLEVPRSLMEQIKEAFLSGVVTVETLDAIKQLLTDTP